MLFCLAVAPSAGAKTHLLVGAAEDASKQPDPVVAKAINCVQYKKTARHDESVYRYYDQGTCVLDGTVVTITTFDRVSDGTAFASVMKAVIPLLHPTWVGATYAAGDGWNVADARNLTAKSAELAVRRLGAGATYVIPAATHP